MVAIATQESNQYAFSRASVTWHFIEENPETLQTAGETEMNYLASFEADMLNFRNQRKAEKDFISTFIGNSKAILNFEPTYKYCSEGKKYNKITDPSRTKIEVKLSVNKTFVRSSKITLWHLTVTPAKGRTFSENDLIKLAHNFGSIQEGITFTNFFHISDYKEKGGNIEIKVNQLLDTRNKSYTQLQSGIIQIDAFHIFGEKKNWTSFTNFILTKKMPDHDLKLNNFSKTLCGIILGIFHFERMNEDEIIDTIQPIVIKNTSFVVLCRGTLLKLTYNEENCDPINKHILVDPYLLIPDMVLSHNVYVLNKTLTEIENTLTPIKKEEASQLKNIWQKLKNVLNLDDELHFLEKNQSEIRNTLSLNIINDVFQYSSEIDIIRAGKIQRGIESMNAEISQRLNDLSELILVKRGNKTIISDASVASFLAFITMLQFIDAFFGFKNYCWWAKLLFTAGAITVALVVYRKLSSKKTMWFKFKK